MTNADIQVGEYVRTNNARGIRKVDRINEEATVNRYLFIDGYDHSDTIYGIIRADQITKHSFNLIDLIEVGDYVNGEMITKDRWGNLYCCSTYIGGEKITTIECYPTYVREMDKDYIDTIVTHEQFANMEYKIGGEND